MRTLTGLWKWSNARFVQSGMVYPKCLYVYNYELITVTTKCSYFVLQSNPFTQKSR